jgi:hypothetical protein
LTTGGNAVLTTISFWIKTRTRRKKMDNTAQDERGLPEHGVRICWDGHVAYSVDYLRRLGAGHYELEVFTYIIFYGDRAYGVRPDEKEWWMSRPYVSRGWLDIAEYLSNMVNERTKNDECVFQKGEDGITRCIISAHEHERVMTTPVFKEPELPPITNIRRYRYRPGDKIIVRLQRRLSQDMVNYVQKVVANRLGLPNLGDVLVLDEGNDIRILRNTQEGIK